MSSIGSPGVYNFNSSIKAIANRNDILMSDKKRSLLKWANTAGVSSAHLNYLWDHIIGDIFTSSETSNSLISNQIKDLQLTVESLKATIDELVVSNKCNTMKMREQEKNYQTLLKQSSPKIETTYNDDYSPPRKVAKINSKANGNVSNSNTFDDQSDLDQELESTTAMLEILEDYSSESCEVVGKSVEAKVKKAKFSTDNSTHKEISLEISEMFPIKLEQQLNDIEELLVDDEFAYHLNEYLVERSPASVEIMLSTLRMLIDDRISGRYTFKGTQTKMSFQNTLFNKAIFNAWKHCFDSKLYKDILIKFFATVRDRQRTRMRNKRHRLL